MDVGPNLSVGITLTYVSGSYRYDRSYKEEDTRLAHQGFQFNGSLYDLRELDVADFIDDNISGFNAKFGLMYREPDKYRIGFTIKTPTAFSIDESFGTTATSIFWTQVAGTDTYGPYQGNSGSSKYDVTTPWVFGASASVIIHENLVLSAEADYTDWTQTQFSNATQDVLNQNPDFATTFQGTVNFRGGAEFEIPRLGVKLRGGFMLNPSIYKGDPSTFNQKYVTGGLGFSLGESSMLDLGYAYGWRNDYRVNYNATSPVQEKVTSNLVLATFSHRF